MYGVYLHSGEHQFIVTYLALSTGCKKSVLILVLKMCAFSLLFVGAFGGVEIANLRKRASFTLTIICFAKRYIQLYLNQNLDAKLSARLQRFSKWQRPEEDTIKINCDGAIFADVIAWDHKLMANWRKPLQLDTVWN
ncbi:UNVERIFIED_CONTAM: hypothetical protein Sindi_0820300 [Sesamum indicum]